MLDDITVECQSGQEHFGQEEIEALLRHRNETHNTFEMTIPWESIVFDELKTNKFMDFICSFFFLVGSRVIFSCGRTCIGGENVKAVTMQNSEHVKTNFRVFGGRFEEQSCCTSCRPLKEDTCVHLKHLSIPNSS